MTKAAQVNLLWLATGEGPMQGEKVEPSRGCDVRLLTAALAVVEQLHLEMPSDRKAKVTAALYALFVKEGRALDPEAVRQFVQSLLI